MGNIYTVGYKIKVGWRCSKCGRINMTFRAVEESSRSEYDCREALTSRLNAILKNADNGIYGDYLSDMTCDFCAHKEPWAKFKSGGSDMQFFSIYLPGLLAILSILLMRTIDLMAGLVSFAVSAAIILLLNLLLKKRKADNQRISSELTTLPYHLRPFVSIDYQDLARKMKRVLVPSGYTTADAIDDAIPFHERKKQ